MFRKETPVPEFRVWERITPTEPVASRETGQNARQTVTLGITVTCDELQAPAIRDGLVNRADRIVSDITTLYPGTAGQVRVAR